ncbi:hypothetical protein QBC37DRAFT_380796 [Rhypophila decipiens]|uniref:Uncharacterized protein n=1 Tax=Rhypophila decipiens TaxID=261697 RepID=A0AAN6XTQ9_9PEZI|nr:hypothetical protein QBC37DRAFT_380796 [Rhypophila decipiens]
MLPFRATPAIQTMRVVVNGTGVGLFPRPVVSSTGTAAASAICLNNQRHFFLPALQQRFASLGSSGRSSISSKSSSSASSAMDEIIDADIDISDPPEAVGASNAATARANSERMGHGRVIDEEGNTVLYASAGALGLLGLYSIFHEPIVESGSSGSSSSGGSGILSRSSNELDPGTDARGRTSPLSSIKASSRQHHDLPAHAPGGETIEFKLGRG